MSSAYCFCCFTERYLENAFFSLNVILGLINRLLILACTRLCLGVIFIVDFPTTLRGIPILAYEQIGSRTPLLILTSYISSSGIVSSMIYKLYRRIVTINLISFTYFYRVKVARLGSIAFPVLHVSSFCSTNLQIFRRYYLYIVHTRIAHFTLC